MYMVVVLNGYYYLFIQIQIWTIHGYIQKVNEHEIPERTTLYNDRDIITGEDAAETAVNDPCIDQIQSPMSLFFCH